MPLWTISGVAPLRRTAGRPVRHVGLLRPSLLLALAFQISPSLAGESATIGKVGGWHVYAWFNDDGAFGHCGVETGSKTGAEKLIFSVNKTGYILVFGNPDWTLRSGGKYDATVSIHGQKWSGKANATANNIVVMSFPTKTKFGYHFMRGSRMDFKVGNLSRTVDLTGTIEATKLLLSCIKEYLPSASPLDEG